MEKLGEAASNRLSVRRLLIATSLLGDDAEEQSHLVLQIIEAMIADGVSEADIDAYCARNERGFLKEVLASPCK